MNINPEDIRRSYELLSDDMLLSVERASLTETAQKIYDQEVATRGLTAGEEPEDVEASGEDLSPPSEEDWTDAALEDEGPPPDWMDEAAAACAFMVHPHHPDIREVVAARAALKAAGIPCRISVNEIDATDTSRRMQQYCVMVPGSLTLHATSIIDKVVFNPRQEEDWRTHLEQLSDEEIGALDPDIFCAGLLDRVARLRKAYNDEVATRSTERR